MSTSNPFDRQRRRRDPGDTRAFLRREGWTLVDEKGGRERWVGYYQKGDVYMAGGLIRTAGGRRKFFVRNPTRRFWKNAHNGRCQMEDAKVVENAYRLHWNRKPDAWVDGLRRIEQMI